MKQYLFAYGTLRKGSAPPEIAEIAEKLKFVGEGFVYGSLLDLGKYKSIAAGEEKVFGHLFELPDDEGVLRKLDEYEGYLPENPATSLFLRKQTTVFLYGAEIISWIYEYNWD